MDIRCKLLGHVRDSTEFEERHEDRPRGTILICREYQVCGRCGDRTEMYRNEQVLSTESVGVDSNGAAATADSESHESGDGETRPNERSTDGPADTPDEQPGVGGEGSPETPETTPGGPGSTEGSVPANADDETVDTETSTTGADGESAPGADDAGRVTDDGIILSDSNAGPSSHADSRHGEAVADGRGPTSDGRNDPVTSLFDAENDQGGRIRCDNCNHEWERDGTSLREGDICPECRGAYVDGR